VAKKKGSRKTASRGVRKKAAVRRGARKAVARPGAARTTSGGTADANRLDLRPIEKSVRSQITRLKGITPTPGIERALAALYAVQERLLSACAGEKVSMVIDFSSGV
jgi:hypothetical protein